MSDPASLSAALIEAFNRGDADAIAAMVAPEVDYRRASSDTLRTPAEVRDRYAKDFETTPGIHAEITEVVAATDTDVAFEIVVGIGDLRVTGAAHHRWVDGRLVRYRSWTEVPR